MKRYFFARLATVCLVVLGLAFYQQKALAWRQLQEKNQEEIAKVEEYNKQIRREQVASSQAVVNTRYADGSFEGTAKGFGGDVKVAVTIEMDEIIKVDLIDASHEDEAYLSMAMEIPKQIVEKQTVSVDVVSGATYSSNGIIEAVKVALHEAEQAKKGK